MWYEWKDDTLILRLRVQPKASSNALAEMMDNARKLRITAPPVDGKANKHIVALIAKMCKVAKSDVKIVSGELGRSKTVAVTAPRLLPDGVEKPE
jgi:uncharacterized protein (TIGR00251 family)